MCFCRSICSLCRCVFFLSSPVSVPRSKDVLFFFLTLLQALPKPKKSSSSPTSPASSSSPDPPLVDPDSELARVLQPLLEQEALLETFVEEAKAHRKFEDVQTLKANLAEIRAEIDRMLAGAEAQGSGKGKGGLREVRPGGAKR